MKAIVVGCGPAGLMSGYQLLKKGFQVDFFDHKNVSGRKFLVAGDGGFNLTHSEPIDVFIEKYNSEIIKQAVREFTNVETIAFLSEIGVETFVGSSGKIFPKTGTKPIEVLNAWMNKIINLGGVFHFKHSLLTFTEQSVFFKDSTEKVVEINYDYCIFSLGGNSWAKTGSTGEWISIFVEKKIELKTFQSSNSGFDILELERFDFLKNTIFKNVLCKVGNSNKIGDVFITNYGFEGIPIYYLNKEFRDFNYSNLSIDFKPTFDFERVLKEIALAKNISEGLKKLKLPPKFIELLKRTLTKEQFLNKKYIAELIKNYSFEIKSLRPIDEVISTVGGVSMDEVDIQFRLKKYPNIFCVGEMLDWDAPTGGYLLQACFATGFVSAQSISQSTQIV